MFTAMSEVYSPSSSGLKSSNALTQTLTVQLPGIINKGYKEPGACVNKVGGGEGGDVGAGGVVGGVTYGEKVRKR